MSADRAAAVAALLDGGTVPPSNGTIASTYSAAAAPRRPGRPPLDPSQLSQTPDAIRARRRREERRSQDNGRRSSPPAARSFTPATQRELPPPPPPPAPAASADDIHRATGFVRRIVLMLGTVAAKLLHDDRMIVPESDAQEAAEVIIDAWPELAVLDADGKKVLAVMYVGSLVGERYGMYKRGRPTAQRPVAVVEPPSPSRPAPADNGSLRNMPIVGL